MTLPETFTLNTGAKIPAVGFGTWQAAPHEVEKATEQALRCGYRHLDCAAIYRNEVEVGAGIKASGVPRSDIFITSKVWNSKHLPADVEPALDKTLKDLGTDYVDLYLMHWPVSFKSGDNVFPIDDEGIFQLADIPIADTYAAMEKLLATGKVKAIGVSNFTAERLDDLLSKSKVVPAVNQIELHPYFGQDGLLAYCKSKGIIVEAYSPLGNNQVNAPKAVDDPVVQALAKRLGMDAGQVLYSWAVQRGTVVLPKSVTPHRIESNLKVKELPKDAVAELDGLEKNGRLNKCAHWGVDIFQEVGAEAAKQGGARCGRQQPQEV